MRILKTQETEFVYVALREFQSEMSRGAKSRLSKTDEREFSKVLSYLFNVVCIAAVWNEIFMSGGKS